MSFMVAGWEGGFPGRIHSRSLSGLRIVGCETASAVHFLPAFCPIAGYGPANPAKTVLAGVASRYRRPKSDRLLGRPLPHKFHLRRSMSE